MRENKAEKVVPSILKYIIHGKIEIFLVFDAVHFTGVFLLHYAFLSNVFGGSRVTGVKGENRLHP